MAFNIGKRESFGPTDEGSGTGNGTAPGAKDTSLSFLGQGSRFDGKLTFEGRVRVEGQFKGEIFSNGILEVGKNAEIEAQIDVSHIEISGTVSGTINARKKAHLKKGAVVTGSLTAPKLVIDEGVVFDGSVSMSSATKKGAPKSASTSGAAKSAPNTKQPVSDPV